MSDAARQEVLAELRRRRVAQIEAGIVAGETTRPRRLSWAQERLWFLSQLEERGEYNLIFAVRICGDFDRHAWDRAITAVVARHAILRTHFMSIDGRPYQVASAGSFSAEFVDLGELDRPDDALDDALRAESTRRFDLSTGPLLHGRVLRKSASEHVLIINVHHIVADGWSIGVFAREATDQYGRECGAQMPAPQPLAIQYADYAEWQRDQDGSAFESRALDHWREVLKGAPPVCNLPTDRPRRASRGERGGVHPFEIAPSLYERVQATAREHATAPFSVLLAAFFALLHRFSHDRDLCVGTPVANRGASAVEPLIGFFVNMVTMRCRLTPEMTFAALLDHVARLSTQALEYQAVPFAKVVQALNPERSLSHAPLFQIVFSLQNTPHGVLDFPRATVEPVPVATMAGAKYDLLFGLVEQSGRLHGAIEYDTGLFDSRSIDQMARAYITLLDDALAHPRACVGELRVLSVDPSSLALRVTDSVVEQAPFEGAMAMFERVVASVPDRIAVCAGSQTLSYAQLWRRVVRLARHLSDLGVGQEQLVGVCLDRGVDLVVALLAVMRAGGAYVPLDPAYPAERTRFILEDTRVGVVIASADLRAGLPDVEAQTICLGDAYWACDEEAASFCPDELAREAARMPGGPHPEGAAYVIYTSGSTGRPKGVAIRHRSLDVFLKWAHRRYGREAFSFALASTSICFDLSVFEIFAPLTGGGTVLVAQDALDLVNVPQRNRLTMMTVVPSALAALARDDVLPASLLVVNVAGEVLTRAVVDEAHGRVPRARLFNLYGPSEDTTFSTEFEVGQGASGEPSIGRPLPGTVAHVLDERLEPVSKGVVGELYLGGRGVARGYLGKAGLTAERFVPDPFEAGQRLYRTGDLVRSRWDGQLEYIGRADRQIKLRGHRIELGEIEGVLAAHPELQAAAVVLASGSGGAQGLVACCAPRTAVEPEALRVRLQRHLAERLPGYMVPARYLMLERLPLNANGKVDRGRLQDLGGRAWNAGGEDRRPLRGRHQHAVAQIWSEVLGRAEIGATDDFFELGGHSLLATQVLARLRERLGVEMALKTLFEHSRLDALAECVAGAAGRADAPALRRRGGEAGRWEASWGQQRLWFLDRLEPGSAFYNISVTVHLHGELDSGSLREGLQRLQDRHEILRTVLIGGEQDESGVWQDVLARDAQPLPWTFEDWRSRGEAAAGQRWRELAGQESGRGFDLAKGPLWRTCVIQCDDAHAVLIMTLHHAIADGWSMSVLVDELAAHYEAARAGRDSGLPALPVQYADYAQWQREWLSGARLEQQLSYWREQLRGSSGVLELPTDYARPSVQRYRGAVHSFELDGTVLADVKRMASESQSSVFMVLLSAFYVLLWRYSGQSDLNVGTPVANRREQSLEGLIGFFVNTLVLRCEVGDDPSFDTLLARVRELTLEAQQHQDLPFERLVQELKPERDLGRAPLFQVMLVLQNTPQHRHDLPGLRIEAEPMEPGTAKFDLSLQLTEHEQGLYAALEYNTDLFAPGSASALADGYARLLAELVRTPSRRISRCEAAPEPRRVPGLAPSGDLLRALRESGRRHGARSAVSGAGEHLDYTTLWRRARVVGQALRQRGAGPETRIGLCMERTPDLIVGMLGILEAHAAYVPLDPQLPEARLRMLREDSGLSLVLTHGPTEALVERIGPQASVLLSACEAEGAEQRDAECSDEAMPAAGLAYVIYTSGSTGRPKGVSITRGGLLELAQAQIAAFGIGAESRVCQFASIGFDASVSEIFTSVLSGACLVMAEDVQEADRLVAWLEKEAVSHATLPPALLQLLPGGGLPALGTLVSAGERCSWEIVRDWGAGRRLINAYGPTEVTVCASWGEVAETAQPWARVPIGEALQGAELYVLDEGMMPSIAGGSGELYVGGTRLARGYLGRPGASAERFVPHPWREGARLYRTGDRVRVRPDGCLEYLGRRDEQVKIRGVRVEPGELEATLLGLRGVSAAAVAVVGTAEGNALDAYVVGEVEAAELRRQLRARLPGYLQPRGLHRLEALPRTANGKLDRRRLKPVEDGGVEAKGGPASVTEAELCRCMEAVLACGPVGVEDSFFDLGGNSLSAVRLTTVIRERLKLQIQVRDVFMFPSPAMLAGRVEHGGGLPAGSLVPLNHGGHDGGGRVYCAHTLSGEVGIYRPLASRLDCRVHGLRDESGALEPEQAELEARGQAFARTILNEGRGDGPTVILGWSFGACVALETARALRAAGAAAELVLIEPAELDVPISDNREQVILALFMQEWRSAFDLAAGRDLPTVPSTLEELYRLALDQGVLPRTIELATLRERFSRFRRNLNALWHYRPLDYDGPGRVIWSENADNADHRSVWKKILANVKHDIVPGTHRSVMRNPGITRIDSLVRKCLIGPIDDQSSLKTIAMDFNLLN